MAAFLFHDGLLPDDPTTHGWEAVLSFARAFLPSFAVGFVCLCLGLLVRRLAKRKMSHETHTA
jgi:hypothetical protein